MAKANPGRNVFQGEISELALGRTDLERYAKSMRYMRNFVPSRIGPTQRRPGLTMVTPSMDESKPSTLIPFIFNENEVYMLEFVNDKCRFLMENVGPLANRERLVTVVLTLAPFKFTAPAHTYVVGEHLVFTDFPPALGIENVTATVTAVIGNDVTTDINANAGAPAIDPTKATVAAVYEVDVPYNVTDAVQLRPVQWLDTLYLFAVGHRPYVLKRYDTFDWRVTDMPFNDGPYLPRNDTDTQLKPSGKATWVPDMISNLLPTGKVASDSEVVNREAWRAFDGAGDTYWQGQGAQTGWIEYQFVTQTNAIPPMTGPTTLGTIMSATTETVGFEAWRARDLDNATDWVSSALVPQILTTQFPIAQSLSAYTIRAPATRVQFSPRDWFFDGSNTGLAGSWTTLDTQTDINFASGQKKQFDLAATSAPYTFFRIRVIDVNTTTTTVYHAAVGTKGTSGYKAAYTETIYSPKQAAIANVEFFGTAGKARIVNGYTLYVGLDNAAPAGTDAHAPLSWIFQGYDGTAWYTLHKINEYKGWNSRRSAYFSFPNQHPYQKYRWTIRELVGPGLDIPPRIGMITMSSPDAPGFSLIATSTVGINNDIGFLLTDIGRNVRIRDVDGYWRALVITDWLSPVSVIVKKGSGGDFEPLSVLAQTGDFRLGIFSDTTGWPLAGVIWEDRMWCGGSTSNPDTIVASKTGFFGNFQASAPDGVVTDEHGLVLRVNSKRMSQIRWISSDENGVLVGTGVGEFVITSPSDEAVTARNIKARPTTRKGAAAIEPVTIDGEVVFIQRLGRSMYVYTKSSDTGKYAIAQLSMLQSHLVFPAIAQITYQAEPHSVIWARRVDGSVIALSVDPPVDVLGGHRHDFGVTIDGSSAFVENIAVMPSTLYEEDIVWMCIRRIVNGVTRRYIERMEKYWDFGLTINNDCTFVDSALRGYADTPASTFYGFNHLIGEKVDVLADGLIYRDVVISSKGALNIPKVARSIVAGLRMISEGEISGLDEGGSSKDSSGTAQGKSKRPHSVVIRLWDSYGGDVGRYNEDSGVNEYTPIEYPHPYDEMTAIILQTAMVGPMTLPMGYGYIGGVRFRQTDPLPMNVIALYPNMETFNIQ